LGAIFYQLLTGQLPFVAGDPLGLVHALLAVQPAPVAQLRPGLPMPLSDIIAKLLAADPRDRYQSTAGLARDLARCQANWQSDGRIEPFALGKGDVLGHLLLPQTLYGRTRELGRLLRAFDAARNGVAQLLLVSGASGVGKTSLVDQLGQPVVAAGGRLIVSRASESDQHALGHAAALQVLGGYNRQGFVSRRGDMQPRLREAQG